MSIQHQSQIADTLRLSSASGGHKLLRRAVVASTSLLTVSAAMGWGNPALAAGTCGMPSGGVVNCGLTSYPGGINYSAGNAVDDLTVNVGAFAGQSGAVTVGGAGIFVANNPGSTGNASQSVYVGQNVTVATTGAYASGIAVESFANRISGGGSVYSGAYATAKNSGAVTVSGQGAHGIEAATITAPGPGETVAAGYATAIGTTTVYNSGTIVTKGAPGAASSADGIFAEAIQVSFGGAGARAIATDKVVNSGSITTSGDLAAGIYGTANAGGISPGSYGTGGAYVNINNSGAITTAGMGASGIVGLTTGVGFAGFNAYGYSVATVANSGAISTTGVGSEGIEVKAEAQSSGHSGSAYASANVTNSGSITTRGAGAIGIYALAGDHTSAGDNTSVLLSAPYANSTVVNTGDITTSGASAAGIVAISSGTGAGAYMYSAVRSTVTSAGAITTSGDGSAGIYALSQSNGSSAAAIASTEAAKTYSASTVTNAGAITTSGIGAVAVASVSDATSFAYSYSKANANGSVTNAGSIKTAGQAAYGIAASATSHAYTPAASVYQSLAKATTTVMNVGAIQTTGVGANGIVASSASIAAGSADAVATSATSVTNADSVSVKNGNTGILAYSNAYATSTTKAVASATTTVINAGGVSAAGTGGTGIQAAAVARTNAGAVATHATVVNTGDVSASGTGGVAVKVEAAYATLVTYAASIVEGGKGAGASGAYTNAAEGIVSNAGTIGSASNSALVMNSLLANIVNNTGTITGFVTLHTGAGGQNVFYNYGTWNARGGDSDFTHGSGGGSNLVNEIGGTIVVVGNQEFANLDTFTNLGLVTMQQAATGAAGRPAYETLEVSGDYVGIGGTLAVDANGSTQVGDVLKIDGAASGSTHVKTTIQGTPGQTTGKGILVVEAASGTAASEFTLTGNTSAHTEEAGGFEYNLNFVPGAGTSGDWYLQSHVFPGTYQFGQIGSDILTTSDMANVDVTDLLSQAQNSVVQSASLDAPSQIASADNSFVPAPNGPGVSGWGRFDETLVNIDPTGSEFGNYKLRVQVGQFGLDDSWHNANNTVIFGCYFAPFHSYADFTKFGDAHINVAGTAYALYGLWFSGPWQAGLRLNYDDNSARFYETYLETNAVVNPNEKGIQAAASYMIPFDGWTLQPRAELNYGATEGSQFTDGVGDDVRVGSTNDFWGKLNAHFSTDVTTDRGLLVQPYANIGLLYRGDTTTNVHVGTFGTSSNVNGVNGDFAVGVNTYLAANLSLSAQADYLAGSRANGWTGFMGLRYTP